MEDLKREFENDPVKQRPTDELKPPQSVSQPLLDQHMTGMEVDRTPPKRAQSKMPPNNDKEETSATALPTAAYKVKEAPRDTLKFVFFGVFSFITYFP